MTKVRLPSQKSLIEFASENEAFDWVRKTQSPCLFEVLLYEGESLSAMDRYYFDGDRFVRENILS